MAIAFLAPFLPFLKTAGSLVAGGAMAYWATTNLVQTGVISKDRAKQLELDWAKYSQQEKYLGMREDELELAQLEYNKSILESQLNQKFSVFQTLYMGEMDKNRIRADTEADANRIQTQVDLATEAYRQQLEEKNTYLRQVALQSITQEQNVLAQYGDEKDLYKLSFIIDTLESWQHTEKQKATEIYEEYDQIPEENSNFNYANGDDLPPEAY